MKKFAIFQMAAGLALLCSVAWAQSPAEKGKVLFDEYGCSGCHAPDKTWGAPDLTKITLYYKKERLIDYVVNTQKHYNDPAVKTMAQKYKVYMGDLDVKRGDAELIYEYLKSLTEKKKIIED